LGAAKAALARPTRTDGPSQRPDSFPPTLAVSPQPPFTVRTASPGLSRPRTPLRCAAASHFALPIHPHRTPLCETVALALCILPPCLNLPPHRDSLSRPASIVCPWLEYVGCVPRSSNPTDTVLSQPILRWIGESEGGWVNSGRRRSRTAHHPLSPSALTSVMSSNWET
jgi:hypothetical protein